MALNHKMRETNPDIFIEWESKVLIDIQATCLTYNFLVETR